MLYSVYAESTPNPAVMKFVTNRILFDNDIEINSIKETRDIAIAKSLFNFPFIKSIFLSSNFISITKTDNVKWDDIAIQVRIFITDFLNEEGIQNYSTHVSEEKNQKANTSLLNTKEYSEKEKK